MITWASPSQPRNQPSRKDGVLQDGCHDGCGRPWCRDHPSTLRRRADGGQCYGTLGCLTQGGRGQRWVPLRVGATTVLLPVTWNVTIIYTSWVKKKVLFQKSRFDRFQKPIGKEAKSSCMYTWFYWFYFWTILQRTGSVTISYYSITPLLDQKCVVELCFLDLHEWDPQVTTCEALDCIYSGKKITEVFIRLEFEKKYTPRN